MENIKRNILSLTFSDLQQLMVDNGMPKFRAKQLWDWLYIKGEINPENITNFSKADQEKLATFIDFSLPEITTEQTSMDGTRKWLFKFVDGHEIETVFIPEYDWDTGALRRGTLCVSSQVGCTLTCRFCHTGTQGLSRNLQAHEIVGQLYLAKLQMDDFNKGEARKISNIVFMGMGEPLYNWDNVEKTCHIIMDENGLGLGSRKITISTSGMVDNIEKVGVLGTNLAISIHAPDTETRKKIMPITNKWDVEKLVAAIRAFPLKERRRITWEYVMLDGVNDSVKHAKDLVKLIQGIPSLVNIIPFNPWPGSPFGCSSNEQIDAFAEVIRKARISMTVRKTRGEDILAACGQLRGETSKFNTVSVEYPSVVAQYGNDKQKSKVIIDHVDD